MTWPITFRGERPEEPRVGDAYFVREDLCGVWSGGPTPGAPYAAGATLTPEWEGSGRRPIAVVLPDGYHLPIDSAYWGGAWGRNPSRAGWHVVIQGEPVLGERLRVTLSPSVNIGSSYHGFIRDGVISEDVEGRKFDREGRRRESCPCLGALSAAPIRAVVHGVRHRCVSVPLAGGEATVIGETERCMVCSKPSCLGCDAVREHPEAGR